MGGREKEVFVCGADKMIDAPGWKIQLIKELDIHFALIVILIQTSFRSVFFRDLKEFNFLGITASYNTPRTAMLSYVSQHSAQLQPLSCILCIGCHVPLSPVLPVHQPLCLPAFRLPVSPSGCLFVSTPD